MATSLLSAVIIFFLLSCACFASNIDPSTCMKTTESIKNILARAGNQTLRVVVPWKVGFEQFVQFKADSCIVDGFSIQVFLQAVRRMGADAPRFEFILHGNGKETPVYNELVDLIANGTVDAVVADLTITHDRMEKVEFTVPYLASRLVMLTPFRYGSAGTLWDFLKPFSWQLWLTLLGGFVATGAALYLLENQNPDFHITAQPESVRKMKHPTNESDGSNNLACTVPPSHDTKLPTMNGDLPACPSNPSSLQRQGPPIYDEASHRHRIVNAYWFTSLCVFAAQQESVRTHLGRFVAVIWLFVMLIFNSNYTASMASLLSAQKMYPTIKDLDSLLKDGSIKVGSQSDSFVQEFILDKIHIEKSRVLNYSSEMEFAQALRDDSKAGVGAVLDELPYIQIILQSECDFTKNSMHVADFAGLGFAFAKDSPWIANFSKQILAMAQDGTLQVLKNGWGIDGEENRGRCREEPSHLRLRSFGGLFSMLGVVYITCIIIKATHSCPPIKNVVCMMCGAQGGSIIQRGVVGGEMISFRSNRVIDENTI